jgi:hypothetical protein
MTPFSGVPLCSAALLAALVLTAAQSLPASGERRQTSIFSKYLTCSTDADCTGSTVCVSGGCVDTKSLVLEELAFAQTKPNNVYFAFSLWDSNCNPAAMTASDIASRFQVYDNDLPQSKTESFNGLLGVHKVLWGSNISEKISFIAVFQNHKMKALLGKSRL